MFGAPSCTAVHVFVIFPYGFITTTRTLCSLRAFVSYISVLVVNHHFRWCVIHHLQYFARALRSQSLVHAAYSCFLFSALNILSLAPPLFTIIGEK